MDVEEEVIQPCICSFGFVGYHVCGADKYLHVPGNCDVPAAIDAAISADKMRHPVRKHLDGVSPVKLHIFVRSRGAVHIGNEGVKTSTNLMNMCNEYV